MDPVGRQLVQGACASGPSRTSLIGGAVKVTIRCLHDSVRRTAVRSVLESVKYGHLSFLVEGEYGSATGSYAAFNRCAVKLSIACLQQGRVWERPSSSAWEAVIPKKHARFCQFEKSSPAVRSAVHCRAIQVAVAALSQGCSYVLAVGLIKSVDRGKGTAECVFVDRGLSACPDGCAVEVSVGSMNLVRFGTCAVAARKFVEHCVRSIRTEVEEDATVIAFTTEACSPV